MKAALAEVLQERRRAPRGEEAIVTSLAHSKPGGSDPEDAEILKVLIALSIGGLESTGAVLSGAIRHLATNPEDMRELQEDLSLLPEAIEEALRLYVNLTFTQRTVTKPTTLKGIELNEG